MSEQIITKTCSHCKEIKPISGFYKNRSRKDGLQSECKTCKKQSQQQYQYHKTKKGKEAYGRYKESQKGKKTIKRYTQSEKGRKAHQRAIKYYHIRHPKYAKAREAVKKAIRLGELPRPDSLQCACGNPAKQYHHHEGYAKEHWLDVIPVCRACHGKLRV